MDERSERIAKRFETPLLVAAVLTIPVIILQFSPPGEPLRGIVDVVNWLIWLAFLAELVVMLVVVPSKTYWLRHHVVDVAIVVLTPPFLSAAVQSTRVLRLLRLARFLRLTPLLRAVFTTEGLRYAALLTLLTAVAGGAGFASVENIPVGDGIYWAISTMTTVGYGDITPTTVEAKLISIVVMLVGVAFASLLIGAVAQRFLAPAVRETEVSEEDLVRQVRDISAQLQELERLIGQRRARN